MYTTLDYVNETLRLLGELPVNSLDTPHPQIGAALAALDSHSVRIQSEGWWFNVERPTLVPQVGTGHIFLPDDTLSVDAVARAPAVAQRGRNLYNMTDRTLVFSAPVPVVIKRHIPFDDLPYSARFYIASSAKLDLASDLDGDSAKVRKVISDKSEHYNRFHAEHIRAVQSNMLDRPTFAYRMREVVGDTPFSDRWVN